MTIPEHTLSEVRAVRRDGPLHPSAAHALSGVGPEPMPTTTRRSQPALSWRLRH